MKKLVFTLAACTLALAVSPVLAANKKSAGRGAPAPKSGRRAAAASHHAPGQHAKTVPAARHSQPAKSRMAPKYTPAAKYSLAPKVAQSRYTPVAKYATPARYGVARTAPRYGVKFAHGYYFTRAKPPLWTRTVYSNRWNTWFYYVPTAGAWYYYYSPAAVYYPMSYAVVATPTIVARAEGAIVEGNEGQGAQAGNPEFKDN